MKNLYEIDLIVNDVFYRGYNILKYIELFPDMSKLDKEAIKATIMDALVYKKIIDPEKESLDIDNLCILDNLSGYCYEKNPFVTSIPLEIKEKLRQIKLQVTGGIPASLTVYKPAGDTHYCIYDINTAISSLFEEFRFIYCDYDSPTRVGVRANDRPFLEVEINNELYLIDALTKRIFKSLDFQKKYNMKINYSIKKSEFEDEKKAMYENQTMRVDEYSAFINLAVSFIKSFKEIPKLAEYVYEFEQYKLNFPDDFIKSEKIEKDIQKMKGFPI